MGQLEIMIDIFEQYHLAMIKKQIKGEITKEKYFDNMAEKRQKMAENIVKLVDICIEAEIIHKKGESNYDDRIIWAVNTRLTNILKCIANMAKKAK